MSQSSSSVQASTVSSIQTEVKERTLTLHPTDIHSWSTVLEEIKSIHAPWKLEILITAYDSFREFLRQTLNGDSTPFFIGPRYSCTEVMLDTRRLHNRDMDLLRPLANITLQCLRIIGNLKKCCASILSNPRIKHLECNRDARHKTYITHIDTIKAIQISDCSIDIGPTENMEQFDEKHEASFIHAFVCNPHINKLALNYPYTLNNHLVQALSEHKSSITHFELYIKWDPNHADTASSIVALAANASPSIQSFILRLYCDLDDLPDVFNFIHPLESTDSHSVSPIDSWNTTFRTSRLTTVHDAKFNCEAALVYDQVMIMDDFMAANPGLFDIPLNESDPIFRWWIVKRRRKNIVQHAYVEEKWMNVINNPYVSQAIMRRAFLRKLIMIWEEDEAMDDVTAIWDREEYERKIHSYPQPFSQEEYDLFLILVNEQGEREDQEPSDEKDKKEREVPLWTEEERKQMERLNDKPTDQEFKMVAQLAHFICPISREIMTDPVVCGDGITYEYKNIKMYCEMNHYNEDGVEWKTPCGTSTTTQLIPNIALRSLIHEFLKTTSDLEPISNSSSSSLSSSSSSSSSLSSSTTMSMSSSSASSSSHKRRRDANRHVHYTEEFLKPYATFLQSYPRWLRQKIQKEGLKKPCDPLHLHRVFLKYRLSKYGQRRWRDYFETVCRMNNVGLF